MLERARIALMLVLALAVEAASCTRSPDPDRFIERLPELPAHIARTIGPTKTANVLMTKSPRPVRTAIPTPDERKQRACTKDYDGYVVYPLTVCGPPIDVFATDELRAIEAQSIPSQWAPTSQATRYYRLSNSKVGTDHLFCTQSGGPWYAKVRVTESCQAAIPDQSVLTIIGGPQPFALLWDGDLSDSPPPFNPGMFGFVSESCTCCGGFIRCPDGSCVPHGVGCDSKTPQ